MTINIYNKYILYTINIFRNDQDTLRGRKDYLPEPGKRILRDESQGERIFRPGYTGGQPAGCSSGSGIAVQWRMEDGQAIRTAVCLR